MDGKELYVLGYFNENDELECFVRKGRNWSISGYDNISSAKRGLRQSLTYGDKNIKILKATGLEVVE
jgi:hypothetical protein